MSKRENAGARPVRAYNREAWDRQVREGNRWTLPVSDAVVEAARAGEWQVVLTGLDPVPRDWFPASLEGLDLLALASGGGQQGPTLAAAGARVTVLDNSPEQLARDRAVSDRNDLGISTVEGDMTDLSAFEDESFDLVFHPVSNVFSASVKPIWQEAHRVLRAGGELLAGFMNPAIFVFDYGRFESSGERVVRFRLPYADPRDLTPEELALLHERGEPYCFSHSLTEQIGGQLEAGFVLTGLYEGVCTEAEGAAHPSTGFLPEYVATRARKPTRG